MRCFLSYFALMTVICKLSNLYFARFALVITDLDVEVTTSTGDDDILL